MKKLFRLNNNICDQIFNEAQIHFTKNCSNRCPFCIDAFNNGVGNKKPDIDKIFLSVLNIKDNIDDIEKLNKWKQKNTKFYNNAIDVWTKRDQLKIKTAKDNNLNYKAFYSLNELKQYLEI